MNTKRKTLQKIAGISAVGATLPNAWTKPFINSVLLPVHAQTSEIVLVRARTDPRGSAVRIDGNDLVRIVEEGEFSPPFTNSIDFIVFVSAGADGSVARGPDFEIEILVESPFSAAPEIVTVPFFSSGPQPVEILDRGNRLIKTVFVDVFLTE